MRSLSSRAGRVVGIDVTLALDGAAAGVQLVRALLGQEAAALEVLEGLHDPAVVRVRPRVRARVRVRVQVRVRVRVHASERQADDELVEYGGEEEAERAGELLGRRPPERMRGRER